MIYKMAFFHKH